MNTSKEKSKFKKRNDGQRWKKNRCLGASCIWMVLDVFMVLIISTHFTEQTTQSLILLLSTYQPWHIFSLEVEVPSDQIWKS